jgi:hypothetical protein
MSSCRPISSGTCTISAFPSNLGQQQGSGNTTRRCLTWLSALHQATCHSIFQVFFRCSGRILMYHDRFQAFSVYITTHADPDRGDLHFEKGDGGAARLKTVRTFTRPQSNIESRPPLFRCSENCSHNLFSIFSGKGSKKTYLRFSFVVV